ncbi:MAG: IPExxxVDY family protein [Bacteroidota bacterium]
MSKLVLDMNAMQEDFFDETAMIGIVTAVPGYRLCWLLNRHFNINFTRSPELTVYLQRKEVDYCFPVYQCDIPNSEHKYLLYHLKQGKEPLLPETKQLDFIWLLKTDSPDADARDIAKELRSLPDIQLAQMLAAEQLKSINNLLV